MKLEVGKLYQTRDGRRCVISCREAKYNYIADFIGIIIGESEASRYYENGSLKGYEDSPFDLISEWPSTPAKNPVIYDRSLLPAWANKAIAMDEDGRWYCYSSIPHHSKDVWACFQVRVQGIPEEYRPRWSGDWKDSLLVFEDHE